jgi:hypothetical protein
MTSRQIQTMWLVAAGVALGASLAARSVEAQQPGPTPQERVAALKQSMQESQAKLRQYEWIEPRSSVSRVKKKGGRRSAATTALTARSRRYR